MRVGCEGSDGLIRTHDESETCDVCSTNKRDGGEVERWHATGDYAYPAEVADDGEFIEYELFACVERALAESRAEVERLTGCLARANANHEEFERRWYLEQDRAERLAGALRIAEAALSDIGDADREPGDELRLVKQSTLADLLRTQLAVWDAAALEVDERGWREGGPNDGVVYEVPTELVGQRVRIVPEDE